MVFFSANFGLPVNALGRSRGLVVAPGSARECARQPNRIFETLSERLAAVSPSLKTRIKSTPVLGGVAVRVAKSARFARFPGSASYWDKRYAAGGDSGEGSYGAWADYKAKVLNVFVAENNVESVIEWGCGDGNQLTLARYPKYLGLDVSGSAVDRCVATFAEDRSKSFYAYHNDRFVDNARVFRADLALSLDVVYHLVEDDIFEAYMRRLFTSARRFVVVYSTNDERKQEGPHVTHRQFTDWVLLNVPDWELAEHRERPGKTDPTEADFFFFRRR